MVTSITPTYSLDDSPIPPRALAFRRRQFQLEWHEKVLEEFRRQEGAGQLTKAKLARRLNKKPEQITRWLASPSNWTLDTLSDLLVGMGVEPQITIQQAPAGAESPMVAMDVLDKIRFDVAARRHVFVPLTFNNDLRSTDSLSTEYLRQAMDDADAQTATLVVWPVVKSSGANERSWPLRATPFLEKGLQGQSSVKQLAALSQAGSMELQ